MIIVTDGRVAELVTRLTGKVFAPPFTCAGIEKDGEVIGGVIFNCYEETDIHVSVAGHGWTKGFLADIGNYCYNQLGCNRITSVTEDPKVVRIAERLGGKIEGCLRNHFGQGRDGFIVGILKDEYRF
jgi:RimJ/RimL family protein N-acetyltransferase